MSLLDKIYSYALDNNLLTTNPTKLRDFLEAFDNAALKCYYLDPTPEYEFLNKPKTKIFKDITDWWKSKEGRTIDSVFFKVEKKEEPTDNLEKAILEHYTITGDYKDKVLSRDIQALLPNYSANLIGRWLSDQHCGIKNIKVDGTARVFRTGIKVKGT